MLLMVAAKENNKQVFFQCDRLKIDGHLHDVHHLPYPSTDIDLEQRCIRENGDVIRFFDRHTPLSNFHPWCFKLDMCEFTSVEQYLQSSKAQVTKLHGKDPTGSAKLS